MIFGEKYDCIYEARGKCGDSLNNLNTEIFIPLGHYACYGDTYRKLKQYDYSEVTYRIYLFKENYPDKNFNLCTKLETKKILRCLQKTVPFSYKFKQAKFSKSTYSTEDDVDFNVLVVNIRGTYAQHLWLTSMFRCFFEWPYNVAAKEACVLQSEIKEVDGLELERENWINLYLTIAAQLGSYSLHGVVDFTTHPKAKTYHEWKQKLESIKGDCSLIRILKVGGGTFNTKVCKRIDIYDQETFDEGTKSRASKYVAAYKDKLSWKK